MNFKIFIRLIACVIFILSVISCRSTGANFNSQLSESPIEVTLLKFEFIPKTLHIKVGQTVRWINKEKRQYHSVWFKQQGEQESDYLFPEDSLEKKFVTPGSYPYRCGPHPEMIGTILVE